MPALGPGWAARLTDVLGTPLDRLDEGHLRQLVNNGVREEADLEFKQEPYGTSDAERRALAGDIAAMANDRGGLIIIGIRDENDVAVELTPVELVDGEEGRLRQTAAGNLAPHLAFETRIVRTEDDPDRGYYLLIVPPSPLRPHAVRKDRDLRYPRRDGATTRWLSESEVADLYRDRFQLIAGQTERLDLVMSEGLAEMETGADAYLAVALVPTSSGSMSIDAAQVSEVEQWARDMQNSAEPWLGFFRIASPDARAGPRRVTLASVYDADRPPSGYYAELHGDGSGFASEQLLDPRIGTGPLEGAWVLNEWLLFSLARCLRLLGKHAVEHAGAFGGRSRRSTGNRARDALGPLDAPRTAPPMAIDGGRLVRGPVRSRHTLVLDSLVGRDQDLLSSARLVAMDLFHAFGSPEVRQIAADGTLRLGSIHEEVRKLAEERGVAVME